MSALAYLKRGTKQSDGQPMKNSNGPTTRIWNADIFACTGCGTEVATQFGPKPVAEHFQQDRYARFALGVAFRFWDKPEDVRTWNEIASETPA